MKKIKIKAGEYSKGGIIEVQLRNNYILITIRDQITNIAILPTHRINLDFDYKPFLCGYSRPQYAIDIENYLMDITTPYYTDKVVEWVTDQAIAMESGKR